MLLCSFTLYDLIFFSWGICSLTFYQLGFNERSRINEKCIDIDTDCAVLSHFRLFGIPWTVAHQVPLSMGFHRQEYWSGLPFPPPGDLPNPGIELCLLCLLHWQIDSFPLCHLGNQLDIVQRYRYRYRHKSFKFFLNKSSDLLN